MLHLGRLHFRENSLDSSEKNLTKFFKKAKNFESKELLDIGRINLGMIKATRGMKDYIDMINNTDYNEFLGMKLKYFSDA